VLRAFVNAQGDTLTARDFPEVGGRSHLPSLTGNSGSRRRETESLDDFLRRMEGLLIQDALIRSGGNKARAAKDLGLSRTTFYHKLASLQKSI
jgi:DNA-binding NtrC family response regulator